MDKETALEVARYISRLLNEDGICVDKTILFGSCARGEAHADSDIDIAIVSGAFSQKDVLERSHMTHFALVHAIRKYKVPIDLLKFTPDEYEMGRSIALQYVRSDGMAV